MEPNSDFLDQPPVFWANVRAIGETVGYTERGHGTIKVPSLAEMSGAMLARDLGTAHITDSKGAPTNLGKRLQDYFGYRAGVLNDYVEPRLMDVDRAKAEFAGLKAELCPGRNCPLPVNKQKGEKRAKAYLTCMVNMIVEANAGEFGCDFPGSSGAGSRPPVLGPPEERQTAVVVGACRAASQLRRPIENFGNDRNGRSMASATNTFCAHFCTSNRDFAEENKKLRPPRICRAGNSLPAEPIKTQGAKRTVCARKRHRWG
jgi:hypothetical protein